MNILKASPLFAFLLFFGHLSQAQTGPGGVGNTLGTGQPRNVLWLEANSLSLADGANILTWTDRSGNNNNLTAAAATSPVFNNTTTPPNGLGYARFNKTDNRIVINSFTDMPQSGLTTIIVYRTSVAGTGLVSYAFSDAQADEYLLRNSDALRTTIDGLTDQSTIATNNNNWRIVLNSWENIDGRLNYHVDGAETGGSFRLTNGFQVGDNIENGGTLAIGNDQDLLNGGYQTADALQGDIAEVIMYDRKLNDAQVRIINNYLSSKYGVTIANDIYVGDTPANGNFDFQVGGVGQINGTIHGEANSAGLILTGVTYAATSFVMHGHNNVANSVSTANLPGGVAQRWNRSWFIDRTGTITVNLAFDIGEGIGGGVPVNKDNYVLLRRATPGTGTYVDQAVSSANKSIVGDRIIFQVANINDGGEYTLGTIDAAVSPVNGINVQTWYSYQTGNWNDPNVWTLDGGVVPLLENPSNEIPDPSDFVVITNGRTINMNINNVTVANMTVGGVLNMGTSSGHNFNEINGNGRIRMSGAAGVDNFPAGVTNGSANGFADATNGGIVELTGTAISLNQNRVFNDVLVNLNSSSTAAAVLATITINGDLSIENGTWQFGDNASTVNRTVAVVGKVQVETNGRIRVGTGNARHEFNLQGDFNNNGGDVQFTNRTSAGLSTEATDGIVDFNLLSATQNQSVICNGPTRFYRIEVSKGLDATYIATITASSAANFELFGFANENHGSVAQLAANNNAIGLIYGTLELRTNVNVPSIGITGNYNVSAGATLWVNGGQVTMPTGNAIVVYGKVQVSAGTLTVNVTSGLTYRDAGTIEIEGGVSNVRQIRTSVLGVDNIGGYIQSGGIMNVGGGAISNDYYTFSLTYSDNVFRMSGGTLTISHPSTTASRGLFYVNSDPKNVSITGGTVVFVINNNQNNHKITSRAPVWNAVFRKLSGTATTFILDGGTSGNPGNETTLPALPLVVSNDLTIEGTNSPIFNANGNDVLITKDLIIEPNATYTTGLNTTEFNGNAVSIVNGGGVLRQFNNLRINKPTQALELNIVNGPATAIQVNGTLTVERGTIDLSTLNISAKGNIVNKGTIGITGNSGRLLVDGTSAQTISSTAGQFRNIEINNTAGASLNTGQMFVNGTLTLTAGVFNIGIETLTLQGASAALAGAPFSVTKMIQTAGNVSDGGLELYYNANEGFTFPLGTNANSSVRYTPVVAQISGFADDGYIRIIPVDQILQTTNLAGGADILSYYWKVTHRDFTTLPTVRYQMTYADGDIGGTETNYVPGRVIDVAPFTRSTDGAADDINFTTNLITFNGTSTGSTFPGTGFVLETANYTAGATTRFTGAPTVYYSRSATATGFPGLDWHTAASWSTVSHVGAAAASFPQAGDIAIIGSGNTGANNHHAVFAQNADVNVAELRFATVPGGTFSPRLTVRHDRDFSAVRVSGPGTFMTQIQAGAGNTPIILGDFGDFAEEITSNYIYIQTADSGTPLAIPTNPTIYPNLRFEGSNGGINDRIMTNTVPITIRRDLRIDWEATFEVSANVSVGQDLRLQPADGGNGGRLTFGTGSGNITVSIARDVQLNDRANTGIFVSNSNPSFRVHTLQVGRNIIHSVGTIDLYNGGAASANHAILELTGVEIGTYTNTSGNVPDLFRIKMNKGTSIATTFSFNNNFVLNGPTNTATKALEINNGLLILNDPAISFALTTGGGNFLIPASGGLQMTQGIVNVSGATTGIILDGLLRINGGTVNMDGGANVDNFIEYSASGAATIEVTSGGLVVGSQIRRGLASTEGILRFTQSGGVVTIAKNAAPQVTRGVFEIANTGSSFTLSGGTFTIVRGINSTIVPSLLLEPATSSVSTTSTITIGNVDTPAGVNSQNIGIKSSISLGNLVLDNSSGNDPLVKQYILPLTIAGDLTQATGCTLNSQGLDLTLRGNWINNGSYLASGNKLILNPTATRTISGSGTFSIFRMDKIGTQRSTLNTNLTVNNELRVLQGRIQTSTNFLAARSNVVFDAILETTGGIGLVFDGSTPQVLSRTTNVGSSTLSVITIRNSNGVSIPDGLGYNFTISNFLRLETGVFDIGGNLVTLSNNAVPVPVNPFNSLNMVKTNNSFTDSGLKKIFPANYTTDFIFPVGQDLYTPVRFNFGTPGNTSGTVVSEIIVRTAKEVHPSIVEDFEAPDPEIVDRDNVLQYYWVLDANGVPSTFQADAIMSYDQSYVEVTGGNTEAGYIAARIRSENNPLEDIDKFSTLDVNESTNEVTFRFTGVTDEGISGNYFAGIENAIPDRVPVYTTVTSGNVNTAIYDIPVPGGGAPIGAVIVVDTGDELTLNINSVRLYRTEIRPGGILNINGTFGHRLGSITGSGTLRITSNTGSAVLPAGFYDDFFGCGGGTLEYAGSGSYDVLGGISTVRQVSFIGSGNRDMANNDLTTCDDLLVSGPTVRNLNNRTITVGRDMLISGGSFSKGNNNRTLTITRDLNVSGGTFVGVSDGIRSIGRDLLVSGGSFETGSGGTVDIERNLTFTSGTFNGGSGTVRLLFSGTTQQQINGTFTGAAQWHRMEINNPAGMRLNGNVTLTTELLLSLGLITPNTGVQFTMGATAVSTPEKGSPTSLVSGRLFKVMNAGSSFYFPIGLGSLWRYGLIQNTSAGPRTWSFEYFASNVDTTEPLVDNLLPADPVAIKTISSGEYWKVSDGSPTPSGVTARIGLSWGIESDVSANVIEREKLKVVAWNDGTSRWDNYGGTTFLAGHSQSQGDFVATTNLSFSEQIVTLGSGDFNNPLPVTFTSFTGETVNGVNILKWETATEINNDRFVLERSTDGEKFVVVGEVIGAGNKTTTSRYSFTDQSPLSGKNYYRLKQIDFDKTTAYHDKVVLLTVEPGTTPMSATLYPNPVMGDLFKVRISNGNDSEVYVRVTNLSGKVIRTLQYSDVRSGSDLEVLLSNDASPGIYLVEIVQGKSRVVHRLIVQ